MAAMLRVAKSLLRAARADAARFATATNTTCVHTAATVIGGTCFCQTRATQRTLAATATRLMISTKRPSPLAAPFSFTNHVDKWAMN